MEESSDTSLRVVDYFDKIDKKAERTLLQASEIDAIWEVASIDSSNSQVIENDILKSRKLFTIGENSISMAEVRSSLNKDLVLAQLNKERILSLIKVWEDKMKRKSQNSYSKKVTKINSWEMAEKAKTEEKLKRMEEKLEKAKAAYVEKSKNKVALVHKIAEDERALVKASHVKEIIKVEEIAANCRACGDRPRKFSFCV